MKDRRMELMQLTVDELVDLIMEMENERPICDLYWETFDEYASENLALLGVKV